MMFGMMIHMEHHQLILLLIKDLISLGGHARTWRAFAKRKVKCYLIFVFMLQHAGMQELVVG